VTKQIHIAVVDCYPMYRQGVIEAIKRRKGFVLVAEGATAEDARRIARVYRPEILLLETGVPDGIEAAAEIAAGTPGVKVVVLTALEGVLPIAKALGAGVKGYILKGVTGAELLSAIELIHAGQPYVTPELASKLLMESKGGPLHAASKTRPTGKLSAREQQVLSHVSRGLTNKEIAVELGLNIRTIKYYTTQLFRKLHVRNRIEAIQVARDASLVP
jgi:DNA-binding NarL/FixJ family response regulator